MFAIVGKLGSRVADCNSISSAFKLFPGRLPAGTAKVEFQRTRRIVAQINRGRFAHDEKFMSIQAHRYGWGFFSGFR